MITSADIVRWRLHAERLRQLAVLLEDVELAGMAQDCEALAAEIEAPSAHTAEHWRGQSEPSA